MSGDETTLLDYADLQAHVLLGFEDACQQLIFFRIEDAAAFRAHCAPILDAITSASDVIERRDQACKLAVAFTYEGLRKLDAKDYKLLAQPYYWGTGSLLGYYGTTSVLSAFGQGCAARSNSILKDDFGGSDAWPAGSAAAMTHWAILVAAASHQAIEDFILGLIAQLGQGSRPTHKVIGTRLPGREHFGYRDGIARAIPDVKSSKHGLLSDQFPGSPQTYPVSTLLLGYHEQRVLVAPAEVPGWAANGSYLVFRQMRQHVDRFHGALSAEASRIGISTQELAEKLIGRHDDGSPLVKHASNLPADQFDYSQDLNGEQCPFEAHIRRANPREMARRHPLFRRSVSYGEVSKSTFDAPIADGVDRGTLFMCYQASIEQQFEYVTKRWLNAEASDERIDALVGRRTGQVGARKLQLAGAELVVPDFVDVVDGLYLLAPSLPGMRALLAA